jgi:hypothetical protein
LYRNRRLYKKMYFVTFINIVTPDTNPFFKYLLPPLVNLGDVLFLKKSDNPLPPALEALLDDGDACQLVLDLWEYEKGRLGQVR